MPIMSSGVQEVEYNNRRRGRDSNCRDEQEGSVKGEVLGVEICGPQGDKGEFGGLWDIEVGPRRVGRGLPMPPGISQGSHEKCNSKRKQVRR